MGTNLKTTGRARALAGQQALAGRRALAGRQAPEWANAGEGRRVAFAGCVERVIYTSGNADGYTVFLLTDSSSLHEIAAAGSSTTELKPGNEVEGEGTIVCHPRYGRQIRIEWLAPHVPDDPAGLRRFLHAGVLPWVGRHTADRLLEHFGEFLAEVLDRTPERLLEVEGIGEIKLAAIREAWKELRGLRTVVAFLNEAGIGPAFATRVWDRFGPQAPGLLRKDPYLLTRIRGLGFLRVDEAALKLGIAPDSPARLRAALLWAAREQEAGGHTVTRVRDLIDRAAELTGQNPPDFHEALEQAVASRDLAVRCDLAPGTRDEAPCPSSPADDPAAWAGRTATVVAEELAAGHAERRLRRSQARGDPGRIAGEAVAAGGVRFDADQRAALLSALRHRMSIITGGPGTGKTTILRALIEAASAAGSRRIRLCAPTGRAARRLADLTGRPASTIHRLLGQAERWRRQLEEGGDPNPVDDPLARSLMIVDEASMVDAQLFERLLRNLPDEAQLVIVGDADQLPSVGPGACLRDLIAGGVPTTRLTRVYRQDEASGIALGARAILEGRMPQAAGGLRLVEQRRSDDTLEIAEVALDAMRRFGEDGVQVLSPMNKGPAGTQEINRALRERLRGGDTRDSLWGLCAGDRVIHTVNDYRLDVMNGEIGKVIETDPDAWTGGAGSPDAEDEDGMQDPGRPANRSGAVARRGVVRVRYPDRIVAYDRHAREKLRHAYAISVHRSQGGQFPCVVLALSMRHYPMLERTLLYTAVSRAESELVIVGERRALRKAVATATSRARRTRLGRLLAECRENERSRPESTCEPRQNP